MTSPSSFDILYVSDERRKPMRKNIYLTLDNETVGGASKPTGTYHTAGIIHDRKGNIFGSFNLLIMEHYDKNNGEE